MQLAKRKVERRAHCCCGADKIEQERTIKRWGFAGGGVMKDIGVRGGTSRCWSCLNRKEYGLAKVNRKLVQNLAKEVGTPLFVF